MWYELEPLPGQGVDDQHVYLEQARRAAAALGLSDRPSIDTWWRMLTHRDDGMILAADRTGRWVCLPDGVDTDVIRILAAACHAKARQLDEAPGILTTRRKWAHAIMPASATLSRTARGGPDDTDNENIRLDPPAGGVIVLNIRRQGHWETSRAKDWLADEFNMAPDTNRLQETGVGVCRVNAGMPDLADAHREVKRAANALNLGITPGVASHASRPGLAGLIIAVLCAMLAVFLFIRLGVWWPLPAAIPLLAAMIIRRARMGMDAPIWQRPRHYWRWRPRMRRCDPADYKSRYAGDDHTANRRKTAHAYAYQRSTFPLPADTLTGLTAPPQAGNAVSTGLSNRPGELETADGPLLGLDAAGLDVRMPANITWDGVALIGKPGGGKSNSMHGLEHWAAGHMHPADSLIVFEAKGRDSFPTLHTLMPGMRFMDVADPATPIVSLLGEGTAHERAQRFATLMRGALGDQQIGPQSRLQLADSVELALRALAQPGPFARHCKAQGVNPPHDWVDCTFTLLFGHGAQQGRALAAAISRLLDDDEARQAVERLHGGVNENTGRPAVPDAQLYQRLYAPMNKMSLLAATPAITASRPTLTWRQLLSHGVQLAINLGDPVSEQVAAMADDSRTLVGALLFQGLRTEIGALCAGWETKNRHVRIFVDELTDITGADGRDSGGNVDAVEWLRSRARAYGAELTVGTQYPEQLSDRLLACITGFRTIGSYVLLAPTSAQTMADVLGVQTAAIRSLPNHVACWRTTDAHGGTLPALTLTVPHFDAGAGV